MRDSIHAICVTSCAFKIHRVRGPARGKPVLVSILYFRSCSRCNFRTQQFRRKPHLFFDLYPTLNMWYRMWSDSEVRCKETDRQTDTHDNYRNPLFACVPRVKYFLLCRHALVDLKCRHALYEGEIPAARAISTSYECYINFL